MIGYSCAAGFIQSMKWLLHYVRKKGATIFLGSLLRVDLIKPVSNVRTSFRPQKVSSISMKFGVWVEGRRLMHEVCSMMTRTKVKVTSFWKSEIWSYSSPIYNGGWQMTTDFSIRAQYLKLIGAGFLIFMQVFVSRDFEVGSK